MADFPMTEASIWTGYYCLLFYLTLLVFNIEKGVLKYGRRRVSGLYQSLMILLAAFFIITHCMRGDFYHLMEKVHNYVLISGYYNYGEEIYPIIGSFVNNNYFLFRVIVWGGAFILFIRSANRMGLNPYNAVMLLMITHTITFSYARATAAMAVYFMGVSLLCNPLKHKSLSYIFGILFILVSPAFHRSALVLVLLSVMLFVPLKRSTIVVLASIFFLSAGLFRDSFELLILSDSLDDAFVDKMQRYSERSLTMGSASMLLSLFDYASFFVPAYISTVTIFIKDTSKFIPKEYKRLCKVAIGIVAFSIMFFIQGATYVTYFYRILYMSMIPLTIILAFLWNNRLITKQQMLISVLPGIIYHILQYLYTIYIA